MTQLHYPSRLLTVKLVFPGSAEGRGEACRTAGMRGTAQGSSQIFKDTDFKDTED